MKRKRYINGKKRRSRRKETAAEAATSLRVKLNVFMTATTAAS
jgi:hypothetical protein